MACPLAVGYGPTPADYLPSLRRFDNRQTKRSGSCQRLTVSQDERRTPLNHGDTEGTENDWETAGPMIGVKGRCRSLCSLCLGGPWPSISHHRISLPSRAGATGVIILPTTERHTLWFYSPLTLPTCCTIVSCLRTKTAGAPLVTRGQALGRPVSAQMRERTWQSKLASSAAAG